MVCIEENQSSEYQIGGSLPANASTYVKRQADEDLYRTLKNREFCYVLNSRQMGKSSLRVRTMERLRKDGFVCADIDLTEIGTENVTLSQWYLGIIDALVNSFELYEEFNVSEWLHLHEHLSPVNQLKAFLSDVLISEVKQDIVIFIDEIDNVLSLGFSADDFFALIRACYNRRAEQPAYRRLTFALFGVATPSDLVSNKSRTPFNIGHEIDLTGFEIGSAIPLLTGLQSTGHDNPQALLKAAFYWAGGQPFLTQKLCNLMIAPEIAPETGEEANWVSNIVQTRIIDNWEAQDTSYHLRTIRDRLLSSEGRRVSRRLGLYQKIIEQGEVAADNSLEQMDLRLTGLVVKKKGRLRTYNPIYAKIFDRTWLENVLAEVRPYSKAIDIWIKSDRQDNSRLLRGQALKEALEWKLDKSLSPVDEAFLDVSQQEERKSVQIALESEAEARKVLEVATAKARKRVLVGSILGSIIFCTALFVTTRKINLQKRDLADVLYQLAGGYNFNGNIEQANVYYEKLLKITKSTHQDVLRGWALMGLGTGEQSAGNFDNALKYFQNSLDIMQENEELQGSAFALSNIGNTYEAKGDYKASIRYFEASLKTAQKIEDEKERLYTETYSLLSLGRMYSFIGDYDKEATYYKNASSNAEKIDDFNLLISASVGLGDSALTQRNYNEAYDQYAKALDYSWRLKNPRLVANNQLGVGLALMGQEKYEEAIGYYDKYFSFYESIGDTLSQAVALNNAGFAFRYLKDYKKSIDFFERVLAMGNISPQIEGLALINLGSTLFQSGDFSASAKAIYKGLEKRESLKGTLSRVQQLSLLKTQTRDYNLLKQALVAQGNYKEALVVAERESKRTFPAFSDAELPDFSDRYTTAQLETIQKLAMTEEITIVKYAVLYEDDIIIDRQQPVQEDTLLSWIVSPDGIIRFHKTDLKQFRGENNASLTELICRTRSALDMATCSFLDNSNDSSASLEDQSHLLQTLHRLLIDPIANSLPEDPESRIVFVPDTALLSVPFSALLDSSGKYFIEDHTITTMPSIQMLSSIVQRPEIKREKEEDSEVSSLVVDSLGLPADASSSRKKSQSLSPSFEMPKEIAEISAVLETQPLLGKQANETDIVQLIPHAKVIHFSSTFLISEAPYIPASIKVSSSDKDDGLLNADEILRLTTNADVVVLEGQGLGDAPPNGILDIPTAFLASGAYSVLVPLGDTLLAPENVFVLEFYRQLQLGHTKAQSFRQSTMKTMQISPEPREWARFTLVSAD